jgi:translation initiation factor IF-1
MTETELIGTVIEIRPKALFLVRLESGQVITANIESRLRRITVRLLVGQKVRVRLSAQDSNRGQITQVAQ